MIRRRKGGKCGICLMGRDEEGDAREEVKVTGVQSSVPWGLSGPMDAGEARVVSGLPDCLLLLVSRSRWYCADTQSCVSYST